MPANPTARESNSTEAEVVAEWRAAMEGVPDGPWKWYPWHVEEGPPTVYVKEGWLLCAVPSDDHAKWVARCSPAGISGLLALIESQRATIERVERERDEAKAVAYERAAEMVRKAPAISHKGEMLSLAAHYRSLAISIERKASDIRAALAQPSTQENDNGR